MHILTLEKVQTLIEHARDDRLHALWVLPYLTGLRIGEAIAPKWTDLDLKSRRVTVQRPLGRVPGRGLQFGPVETRHGNQSTDLPALLMNVLQHHEGVQ